MAVEQADKGAREVLGVARLTKLAGGEEAEFALLITDRYQRRGLGTEMLGRLIEIARDENLKSITADLMTINEGMRRLCVKLGFEVTSVGDSNVLRATLHLRDGAAKA